MLSVIVTAMEDTEAPGLRFARLSADRCGHSGERGPGAFVRSGVLCGGATWKDTLQHDGVDGMGAVVRLQRDDLLVSGRIARNKAPHVYRTDRVYRESSPDTTTKTIGARTPKIGRRRFGVQAQPAHAR